MKQTATLLVALVLASQSDGEAQDARDVVVTRAAALERPGFG